MTSGQLSPPVLDVRGLSVDYIGEHGTVHAVADVSFTLRRGEVLGLAGESGSGKSTLAYAAARLLPESAVISAGEVLFYPGRATGTAAVERATRSICCASRRRNCAGIAGATWRSSFKAP